jgi:hypothetical protein
LARHVRRQGIQLEIDIPQPTFSTAIKKTPIGLRLGAFRANPLRFIIIAWVRGIS